ncbi:MAG: methyltransferase FkbM family [Acidobacteriales bacterium]|nr:methyltransferase FkbM family [Terriglobales bacterium]
MSPFRKNLIYDVGAHRGEDTDFYLKKGFDVIAVEANPALIPEIRKRFKSQLENGQLSLVEAAIAEHTGEVDFYLSDTESVWGTTKPEWAERNKRLGAESRRISVKAVTFGSLLQEYGVPYYLKIDIEGTDLLCLESLTNVSDRPRFVSIESNKESWDSLLHEFEMLQSLGYEKFKIIDQRKTHLQVVPNPSREGKYVSHHFEPECTGLFGDELPGRWLTAEETINQYKVIFEKYRFYGDSGTLRNNLGVRFLRRLPVIGDHFRASWFDTHASHGRS